MEHNHATTGNTDEVFRTFIGCQVKGLLRDRNSEGGPVRILVFDCGWGLAFNDNGSHWTESPADVQRILERSKEQAEETKRELEYIRDLACSILRLDLAVRKQPNSKGNFNKV